MPSRTFTLIGTSPPPVGARKYHGGHWIQYGRNVDTLANRNTWIDKVQAGAPGALKGVQKRYIWRELEPTPGNYDFSEIATDLAWAQSRGLQFMPHFEDKTFQNENPAPDYLVNYTVHYITGGGNPGQDAYFMARWDAYYTSRFKLLMTAAGAQFDKHPNFEGMAIQETALDAAIPAGVYQPYSPTRYRDALNEQIAHCATAFPSCRLFWHFNQMPTQGDNLAWNGTYFNQIIQANLGHICTGGPDGLIEREGLWDRCFPWYVLNKDKCPLFIDFQNDSYRESADPIDNNTAGVGQPAPYHTMDDEFRHAIGTWTGGSKFAGDHAGIFVNYIFWLATDTNVRKFSTDAIAVMNANKTFNVEPSWGT